jgi:hypothetical protein
MEIFTEIIPDDYAGEFPYIVLKIKKSDITCDIIISAVSEATENLKNRKLKNEDNI